MNFDVFSSNSDNAVLKCMGSRNKMGRFQNAGDSDLCGGAVVDEEDDDDESLYLGGSRLRPFPQGTKPRKEHFCTAIEPQPDP
jgi:hypothetical protein